MNKKIVVPLIEYQKKIMSLLFITRILLVNNHIMKVKNESDF